MTHKDYQQQNSIENQYPPIDTNPYNDLMELLIQYGTDAMAESLTILLNQAMKIERQRVLEAGYYQRNTQRQGYANGYKPKTINTRAGKITLDIPQTRDYADEQGRPFYPSSLQRGQRSEKALTLAVAEMYVTGVSTRKVTKVVEKLCGLEITSSQVSRASKELDAILQVWRERPLGEISYLFLDARYEKIRHGGSVISCALLTAIGVTSDGKRTVLGASVKLSEAEVHWRQFLQSLQKRGMHGLKMIISDDHTGLRAAREAVFPTVPWQRCQVHLQRNAFAHIPKQDMKSKVAGDISKIFNSQDKEEAKRRLKETVDKYQEKAPKLSEWMEENLHEGFTIFDFPKKHQKRLRTTNMVERLNRELKRRTRVVTLFPNEQSLLRLASAVLCEKSEEWEAGKIYLKMKDE